MISRYINYTERMVDPQMYKVYGKDGSSPDVLSICRGWLIPRYIKYAERMVDPQVY